MSDNELIPVTFKIPKLVWQAFSKITSNRPDITTDQAVVKAMQLYVAEELRKTKDKSGKILTGMLNKQDPLTRKPYTSKQHNG